MVIKLFRKRISEIHKKFENKQTLIFDDNSNFFGLESSGLWRIFGNGVLLVTEKELFFGMGKPKKELLISIKSIIGVSNRKSFMHKSVFKPLLKIFFKNELGRTDSAA
ncbi:MAG: hypothetical protein ACFFEY_03335 [Candidatus Thorarchaeota archaeon]